MTVNADKAVCVLTCFAPSQNVVDFGNPRGPEDPFLPAAGISPSKTDVETPNGSLDERVCDFNRPLDYGIKKNKRRWNLITIPFIIDNNLIS